MRAGLLHEQVRLQKKGAVTRDAHGGEVITWEDVATVWAEVQPISGREYVTLRAAQSVLSTRFVMRYLPGVAPEWRVLFGDGVYDVLEVLQDGGRRESITLMCSGPAKPVQ